MFQKHLTQVHGIFRSLQAVDYAIHAHEGLPQCSHCLRRFHSWGPFRDHVEQRRCHVQPFELETVTTPSFDQTAESACIDRVPDHIWHDLINYDVGPTDVTNTVKPCTLPHFFLSPVRAKAMDLRLLRSKAQDYACSGRWMDIQHDRELCDHMAHHCIQCGKWCTRSRELAIHIRDEHPHVLLPGIDKMLSIQRDFVVSTPCPFCHLPWSRQHGCPILLQCSILQDLRTPPMTTTDGTDAGGPGAPSTPHPWCCHICQQHFPSRASLTMHMQDHRLTLHRFDPLRDSVEGEPACSHCGLLVTTIDVLRNHITKGHCKMFDATKRVPLYHVGPSLRSALQSGKLGPYLTEAGARTQLTLQCMSCGLSFPSTRELSRHLQTKHNVLWNESTALSAHLKQVIFPLTGCICNPGPAQSTAHHHCVGFRQLAMTHLRINDTILVPWVFTSDMPRLVLPADFLVEPLATDVPRWLVDREFHRLWNCERLIQLLSEQCMLCGEEACGSDLQLHLLTTHHCQERGLMMFVPQIIRLLEPPLDCELGCRFCGLARMDAQAHLLSCPTLIQISSLLALPLHERLQFGPNGGHLHGSIIGGAPVLGPIIGQRKRPGPSQATEARTSQARPSDRGQGPLHEGCNAPHGQFGPTPRAGPSTSGSSGHILALLGAKSGRLCTPAAPGPQGVVGCQGANSDPEGPLGFAATAGASTTAAEADDGRRPMSDKSPVGQERRAARGPHLALPTMGFPRQAACLEQDKAGHDHVPGPGTAGGVAESGQAGRCDPEVPCHGEASGRKEPTLEATDWTTAGSTPWAVDRLQSLESVADPGHSAQTSLPADVSSGDQAAGGAQADVDDMEPSHLMSQLLCLRLSNPSNSCYINASMITMMWASLQRRHFAMDDWGLLQEDLKLLLGRGDEPTLVPGMSFFERQLPGWDGAVQCDVVEFTLALMARLEPTVFHGHWERRYQRENGYVKRYARETGVFALRLTVMPHPHCELYQLVENWIHDSGMLAAFVHLPMLICIQLDRAHPTPGGGPRKNLSIVTFEHLFRVPRFIGDAMPVEHHDYQVVAACTHLGHSGAGHYRALLRCADGNGWMLCEDGEAPSRIPHVPGWFSTQVCLLWAVRLSALSTVESEKAAASATPALGAGVADVLQLFME